MVSARFEVSTEVGSAPASTSVSSPHYVVTQSLGRGNAVTAATTLARRSDVAEKNMDLQIKTTRLLALEGRAKDAATVWRTGLWPIITTKVVETRKSNSTLDGYFVSLHSNFRVKVRLRGVPPL